MAISVFGAGSSNALKLSLGNAIWSRNSVFGAGQSVTLTAPKGAIGLRCTYSNNSYTASFKSPSVGAVLFSESISGESSGAGSVTVIFTEPLKSDSHVTFYYGSGSGANYVAYPIMTK